MSTRLRDVLSKFLTVHGSTGMSALTGSVGKSEQTVNRWLKNGIPNAHYAYKLAVAAGCSDEVALDLANECTSMKAKETA